VSILGENPPTLRFTVDCGEEEVKVRVEGDEDGIMIKVADLKNREMTVTDL